MAATQAHVSINVPSGASAPKGKAPVDKADEPSKVAAAAELTKPGAKGEYTADEACHHSR